MTDTLAGILAERAHPLGLAMEPVKLNCAAITLMSMGSGALAQFILLIHW